MLFVHTLTVLLVFSIANAAVWIGMLPEKPKEFADQEGCYIEEENKVIPFGNTSTPIGYCYRISCGEKFVHYASCGVISTDDPKCYVTEIDLSVPHPECCPTVKCDDNSLI